MTAFTRTLTSVFFAFFACQSSLAAVDCHNVDSEGCRTFAIRRAAATNRSARSGSCPAVSSCPIRHALLARSIQRWRSTFSRTPNYRTSCTRDGATSAAQKNKTYGWYGLPHPAHNTGANQFCELDHLISLELGGADTLENIWPQCGPDKVTLRERYFKQKDAVENYLAAQVKAGTISLHDAQWGIANDWTQYLDAATEVRWSQRFALRSVHRSQPSQQM